MDDVRIGGAVRVMRVRHRWRQSDVARRAGVSRDLVSRLERGEAARLRIGDVRAVAVALELRLDVTLRWHGGDLDRVINARHAALQEAVGSMLAGLVGWMFVSEASFSVQGERGVIDILAWHAASRCLLIIELKTVLADPQELVATMDRRIRLATRIARERGWYPASVSAWVLLSDTRTNRRRVAAHPVLLRSRFPADGHAIRAWLRRPSGPIYALSFWSDAVPLRSSQRSGHGQRVRPARQRSATGG
jgi:transcriptional regulator with XRE-family HTH domain